MSGTLLNEMGIWNPDAIEKQLAHLDTSMMQHWSDYLDQPRDGAKILRPDFGKNRGTPG